MRKLFSCFWARHSSYSANPSQLKLGSCGFKTIFGKWKTYEIDSQHVTDFWLSTEWYVGHCIKWHSNASSNPPPIFIFWQLVLTVSGQTPTVSTDYKITHHHSVYTVIRVVRTIPGVSQSHTWHMAYRSHDTTGPGGRSELVVNEIHFRACPVPKTKDNSFSLERTNCPFTCNKRPPTTTWSPWTMQVINNGLNTRAPSLRHWGKQPEANWSKWTHTVFVSFIFSFHTDTISLETPMFAIGVNSSTWSHEIPLSARVLLWFGGANKRIAHATLSKQHQQLRTSKSYVGPKSQKTAFPLMI